MNPQGNDRRVSVTKYGKAICTILAVLFAVILLIAFLGYKTGNPVGYRFIPFILLIVSFGITAFFLIIFLLLRVMGPFNRLMEEIGIILAGEYRRRLYLRENDVALIRSFTENLNILLDRLEKKHRCNTTLTETLQTETKKITDMAADNDTSDSELRESLISFKQRLKLVCKENPDHN